MINAIEISEIKVNKIISPENMIKQFKGGELKVTPPLKS